MRPSPSAAWHRGPAAFGLPAPSHSWSALLPKPLDLAAPQLSLSPRRMLRSPLARMLAHVLVRLLVIGPLPAQFQVAAALFPFSLLAPLGGHDASCAPCEEEHRTGSPA